ncbi:MAG: hypothetical protein WCF17_10825 [Terracidiphilus sp.]
MSSVRTHGATKVRPASQDDKSLDLLDCLAFLIPFLRVVQLKVIGTLSGSDVAIAIIFLCLALGRRFNLKPRGAKTLLILCSLWLVSQCVTDVVRHTAFRDYARGWSNIGFTLATFTIFFTILYGRPKRLTLYAWGLVIGTLLQSWITPDKYMQGDPWKFGISYPVTWAILLFASRKKCRDPWPVALAMAAGVLNMALGTRSTGGFCLAAALYLSVTRFLRNRAARGVKLKVGTIAAVAATLAIGAIGIVWAYSYAAKAGMLGEQARNKYKLESGGKYGLLLGGRVEVLASIPAIYASPILGHGSWARDPLYVYMEKRALALLGYDVREEMDLEAFKEGYIPEHSYILGAWVSAGILGAVFWFWVFILVVRALSRVYPASVPLLPFAAFAGFETLWDLLFSPYGSEMRIITPFYVVLLMTCMTMASRASANAIAGLVRKPQSGSKAAALRASTVASSARTS